MKIPFLIIFVLCSIIPLSGSTEYGSNLDSIVLSNDSFTKKIFTSGEKPASISVKFYDSKNVLVAETNKNLPLFEFCLNNMVFSSNDPMWLNTAVNQRKMQNGGIEYSLEFRGSNGLVDGLEITIYQQIFPNSTLIREKLILINSGNQAFRLNKNNGKILFKFPQYSLLLKDKSKTSSTEFRLANWESKPITFGDKTKFNHMFYPDIRDHELSESNLLSLKGPISIINNEKYSWMTAFEHASQDNLNGIIKNREKEQENLDFIDPLQGTIGAFNFPKHNDDFKFIDIQYLKQADNISVSVNLNRGAYLDNEEINAQHPYATVWNATAFYEDNDIEKGKKIIQQYLLNQICEKPASRKPEFYYNTWGMQREANIVNNKDIRGVLTYNRIFEEIQYAAELGVDIFVLDDGWEQMQGDWTPNKERLPQGLAPIKQKLDEYGLKMGLWFSPAGIDPNAQRYKEHPEWIILDSEKNPIKAQWGLPAFDMVSDFFEYFIEDCKKLIDDGVLFFKWDALNTFYSSLPNLDHGSDKYSDKEIRERYEYLFPIYITRAMEILTDYQPELVIEIDLTEARRVMMGLAPLSQGKLFFMNNGVSSYNDYSSYRTMSIRTIPKEYAGIIPLELFTFASYPQNTMNSMHYNVNTSLIAGHGFWGNLKLMSHSERLEVSEKVKKSKQILTYIVESNLEIQGDIGDPLEIYSQINHEESAGQIIIFNNEKPYSFENKIKVDTNKFLAVLNQPYLLASDSININFHDDKNFSTNEAFILPNKGLGISILSSTCILDKVDLNKDSLEYVTKGKGQQIIIWNNTYGELLITGSTEIEYAIEKLKENMVIRISTNSETPTIITIIKN